MNATHLKIGAGATLVMRESQWRGLLARTTGHITLAANARLIIIPDSSQFDVQGSKLVKLDGCGKFKI